VAASRPFPPLDRAIVVSIACDVVARTGNPLSRQSTTDLAQRAREELNKPISRTTVWEILDADAIKPWQYEHWLFPRAADFFTKAAVVLDLYEGYYQEGCSAIATFLDVSCCPARDCVVDCRFSIIRCQTTG
jgi:hypothetical protein